MAGPTDTPKGSVVLFDDFLVTACGNNLNSDYMWTTTIHACGTETVTVPAVVDGIVRLLTSTDDQNASIGGQAYFRVQDGTLTMEARVKVDAITTVALAVGLNDNNAEVVLPVTIGACDAFTVNGCASFVGFAFDTDAATDRWFTVAADDAAIVTGSAVTAYAPVAATYETFKIVLTDRGACNMAHARFYRNGEFLRQINCAIDRCVLLAPFIINDARSACDRNFDVDYIEVVKTRAP